jgi:predicted AlkP superfamily pyrophosphatase or phosphodiesterase
MILMKTKILLIGIDGLILSRAIESGAAPTLAALKAEGFYTPLEVEVPTWSGPGWSTILTGSTHAQHGVKDNKFIGHNLLHRPDLLSRAFYQDQSTTTFAAAGWPPIVDPSGLGPIIHERREQQLSLKHRVRVRDGEVHGYKSIDAEVALETVYEIQKNGPDVSFVYFCGADEIGHTRGVVGEEYLEAIRRIDGLVAQLESAVSHRAKENGEPWLIVLTTDHGHIDEGGHGGDSAQERASFLIAVGRGRSNPDWELTQRPENIVELLLAERM